MRLRRRKGWTTVAVYSGLGNQLFQYATGRAVAERTNTRLRFDLSYIGHEVNRPYLLGDFHIRAKVFDGVPRDLVFMADHHSEGIYARERWGATVLRDRGKAVIPEVVHKAPANTFLTGYWQDESHFEEFTELIRHELRPQMTAQIRAGQRRIAATRRSVAVHVRRGDLVSDPGSAARYGALDPGYYQRAAAAVLEKSPKAEFFVFSDDPEWCATELDFPAPMHLVSGDNAPYEDLSVMSACNDFIVANSTFSWWGAWLGESPDSLVLAPAVPFKTTNVNDRPVYPARWHRV